MPLRAILTLVSAAVLAVLAIALLAVTVAASWVPAWRATRVDPVEALRCD